MKKVTVVGLSLLLCAMLASCGTKQYETNTADEVEIITEDDAGTQSGAADEDVPVEDMDAPIVAGAAMYRGVVTDIDEDEDGIIITLAQVTGTDFGHNSLRVAVTSNTSTNVHMNEIAENKYLEVYYGAPIGSDLPETVDAIMMNLLPDADLSIYNGKVIEHTQDTDKEGAGSFLLERENDDRVLFFYDEETQLYLNEIEVGEMLNVYFDGTTTRSIPPQATASEVRLYAGELEEASADSADEDTTDTEDEE